MALANGQSRSRLPASKSRQPGAVIAEFAPGNPQATTHPDRPADRGGARLSDDNGGCQSEGANDHLCPRHRQQAGRLHSEMPVGPRAVRRRSRRPQPHGLLGQPRLLPTSRRTPTCGDPDQVDVDDEEITTRTMLALAKGAAPRTKSTRSSRRSRRSPRTDAQARFPALDRRPSWRRRRCPRAALRRGGRRRQGAAAAAAGPAIASCSGLTRALPARRERLLLQRRAAEGDDRQPCGAPGGRRRTVRHRRAQPGHDDRLRGAAAATKAECDVRLLVTMGSPLGLQEVQDVFHTWTGTAGEGAAKSALRRDAGATSPTGSIRSRSTTTSPTTSTRSSRERSASASSTRRSRRGTRTRPPATCRRAACRMRCARRVSSAFAQAVGRWSIIRDLVDDLEDSGPADLHKTLIQLCTDGLAAGAPTERSDRDGREVDRRDRGDGGAARATIGDDLSIERMRRFVSASLTRRRSNGCARCFARSTSSASGATCTKRALINALDTHGAGAARQSRLRRDRAGDRLGGARHRHPRRPSAFRRAQEHRRAVGLHANRRAGRSTFGTPGIRTTSMATATARMSPAPSPASSR